MGCLLGISDKTTENDAWFLLKGPVPLGFTSSSFSGISCVARDFLFRPRNSSSFRYDFDTDSSILL